MKYLFFLILVMFLLVFGYWYKCIIGIDLFPKNGISQYLPEKIRKIVRSDRIFKDENGVLFHDSFSTASSLNNWFEWPKMKKVDFSYSLYYNTLNHKPCLRVISNSLKEWSLQEHHLIEVSYGNNMEFEGDIRVKEIASNSGIGMILFNKQFKVVSVYFAAQDKELAEQWRHVSLRFKVPQGIAFLRLILSGYNPGEILFDDVQVTRNVL